MKLPVFKLSKKISIPLAIVSMLMATPAMAEQIDRSRSKIDESLPSVTDLNLTVPLESEQPIASQANLVAPVIAPPPPPPAKVITATSEQPSKVRSIKRRQIAVINNYEPTSFVSEQPSKFKSTIRRRQIASTNTNESTPINNRESSKPKSVPRNKLAAVSRPPLSGNYLVLVKDPQKGTNDLGNPIYTLEAYVNGQKLQSVNAVSGTGSTQNRDRNLSNTFAPLPDGTYNVSSEIVAGTLPEVGRTFIAITPRFETERSDLGIHLDPSFNKRNGSDGTAGCIGITNQADRDAINQFVIEHHPRNLIVKIMSN